jgi:tRNA(fMet)-specific endonuclease VapC
MQEVSTEFIAISVVTEAEILFGLERKPEATQLAKDVAQVLLRLQRLPWTSNTAGAYAALRYAAERRGIGISAMDLLIASQAWENSLILVTSDSALQGLKYLMPVEDWI